MKHTERHGEITLRIAQLRQDDQLHIALLRGLENQRILFVLLAAWWVQKLAIAFLGDCGFTPIPVFIGSRQLLLLLIYRGQYPFKFTFILFIHNSQYPFKSMYVPLQDLRLPKYKKCIYIQIDKSPFDNIQSDVRHEAEGGICYQLFPPIQTQGFQNKHNQNMSVYICAGFWG